MMNYRLKIDGQLTGKITGKRMDNVNSNSRKDYEAS